MCNKYLPRNTQCHLEQLFLRGSEFCHSQPVPATSSLCVTSSPSVQVWDSMAYGGSLSVLKVTNSKSTFDFCLKRRILMAVGSPKGLCQ